MTRKLLLYLITTLFVIVLFQNCQQFQTEIIRYGSTSRVESSKKVFLQQHQFKSFEDLRNRAEDISCNDSIPTLRFKTASRIIKEISFDSHCWQEVVCMLIKKRNILQIVDDEIHSHIIYPIDSLSKIIHRHYVNEQKMEHYSEHPNKALISIDYKSKSFDNLSFLLEQITTAFDSLDLETTLIVQLAQVIPPPPSPLQ